MSPDRFIIMKFGGTSVGDAARLRQCAAIVSKAAQQDRVIVVVSAVAGVTDLIFRTIEAARHGNSAAAETHLKKFESVHRELIAALFEGDREAAALDFLNQVFSRLEDSVRALLAL